MNSFKCRFLFLHFDFEIVELFDFVKEEKTKASRRVESEFVEKIWRPDEMKRDEIDLIGMSSNWYPVCWMKINLINVISQSIDSDRMFFNWSSLLFVFLLEHRNESTNKTKKDKTTRKEEKGKRIELIFIEVKRKRFEVFFNPTDKILSSIVYLSLIVSRVKQWKTKQIEKINRNSMELISSSSSSNWSLEKKRKKERENLWLITSSLVKITERELTTSRKRKVLINFLFFFSFWNCSRERKEKRRATTK